MALGLARFRGSINPRSGGDWRRMNNLVYKKILVALGLDDDAVVDVFALSDITPSKSQLQGWRTGENHKNYRVMRDSELIAFLDGLIKYERGNQ